MDSLPQDKQPALRVMPMPADANQNGDIFGGWSMAQVDIAGGTVAGRMARGRVATVAVKEFMFKQPGQIGDLLSFYVDVERIGTTSITVTVEAFAERRPENPRVVKVTEATLTYVAIDATGQPRPGPRAELLLETSTLAAVAALSIGAAIVGGMGGFGTGVILAAALVPLIGVKALVPVMAVAGVIINAGRFWFYRESLERRMLGVVLVSALPFLVLGTWLYSVLEARSVGTILGSAVIASVPLRRILRKKAVMLSTPSLAVGSGIFGLASGLATGTGVILVSLLLGTGMSGPAVLATDALVSIALDLTKAVLFQRFNLLDAQAFFIGLVIGVASIPGSAIAAWLVMRFGARLHVVFMETLIVVGGASMLWHSWR